MKNYFKYDFIKKAIVGSKAAISRANSGKGNEYIELSKMLAEHPDFNVVPKEIEVNENKKKYNGLTFKRMKEYIALHEDGENVLEYFEQVMKVAEAKGAKYPITKKWFLKKFPEYKLNEAVLFSEEEMRKNAESEIDEIEKEEKMSAWVSTTTMTHPQNQNVIISM